MPASSKSNSRGCCTMERKRLMQDIQKCDFCSSNWEEHHQCLSQAAKDSGQRSKACMLT
jgi:hypothetical protein